MAYTTPKTDWDDEYTPSDQDFNRIERNIKHIQSEDGTIAGNKTFSGNSTFSGQMTDQDGERLDQRIDQDLRTTASPEFIDPTTAQGAATKNYVDTTFQVLPYTGSDAGLLDYPIGTIVLVFTATNIYARNSTTQIVVSSGSTSAFTDTAPGSALNGTWRARGRLFISSNGYHLFQRTE